jgi:hypothetical protein
LFLSLTSTIIDFDNPFFILVRHGFGWRRNENLAKQSSARAAAAAVGRTAGPAEL